MNDPIVAENGWNCGKHDASELRTRMVANGIRYVHQCLNCGAQVGNAIKAAEVAVMPPYWDNELAPRFETFCRAKREAARADSERQALSDRAAWQAWYADYLRTPAWRKRRSLVLKRDGYVCRGCGEAQATEVHHLTYAHVGRELLFELVSLCEDCHTIAHDKSEADAE